MFRGEEITTECWINLTHDMKYMTERQMTDRERERQMRGSGLDFISVSVSNR